MRVKSGSLISMIPVVFCVFVSLGYAIEKDTIVGIWFLDEEQGNLAKDSSDNSYDGEILGDVEFVEGKFAGALHFSAGDQNFVSIPHEDSLNLTTWSTTAWINMDSPGAQVIVSKGSEPANLFNYYIQLRDTGIANSGFFSGGWCEAWGTTNIQAEQWYHIAGTYDMGTLTIYVDGTLEAEEAFGSEPVVNTEPLAIGAYSGGIDWGASGVIIDEVGVFNSALSADEVKDIMTKGLGEATGMAAVSSAGKSATAWGRIKVHYERR